MNLKRYVVLCVLAIASLLPAHSSAHAAAPVSCTYVTGLHTLLLDLNKLVKSMPAITGQQAHNRGIALLLREGHFNRKPTLIPADFNVSFGTAVINIQRAAQSHHAKSGSSAYDRYVAQVHHYVGAAWAAYSRHYASMHCKGA